MPSLSQSFGVARMGVGTISWVAPVLTARKFGLDPGSRQPIVTQLFGARDFALGALTAVGSGEDLRRVLRLGVAIDTADSIACLRQMRGAGLSVQAQVLVFGGAVFFAGVGVACLARSGA